MSLQCPEQYTLRDGLTDDPSRTYRTATVRLLRLATNGFIENLQLVIRTIHEFAPTAMESQTADERVTGAAVENGITV